MRKREEERERQKERGVEKGNIRWIRESEGQKGTEGATGSREREREPKMTARRVSRFRERLSVFSEVAKCIGCFIL